ncbi:MAG: hypothetical protein CFE46_11600 [Burkholderiales bacterium PBB6]|nr:MAG: hypothetical protein CFE46_11600 [Burkholderiales bacterium PBB6]
MTPLRVLVVDDNPLNLELVSFVLGAEGMEVVEAVDAEQAQAKLTGFQPDLVLMDVQLPGLDGLALTRLLKADQATRHMKVVAFTAYAMKGDEGKMRAAGCDGYLAKPIDVATFADQVRALAQP